MLTGRTKTRPATAADVVEYFGQKAPQTIRASVFEVDGELIGIAGYYLAGGVAVVFSDNKPDIPKMTIWRHAKAMMDSLRLPAICFATETSGPFLERLGWQFIEETDAGDMYKWQPF